MHLFRHHHINFQCFSISSNVYMYTKHTFTVYISDTPISEVSITASLDVSTLIKAQNKNEIS